MRKHALSRPGIYAISRSSDGKVYIGQAKKVSQRLAAHRRQLELGKHRNGPLQEAWNADGPDAFEWALVAEPIGGHDPEVMTHLEWAVMSAYPDRFNLMEPVQVYLGASASTRAKLSVINKAKWADPEYKERLSAAHKAYLADPDNLAKRRETVRETLERPGYLAQRTAAVTLAWQDETVRATQGAKTKEHWKDPQHRAKQNASRKAAWTDPEKRAKRLAGLKGSWDRLTPIERAIRQAKMQAGKKKPNPMRSTIEVTW